MKIIMKYLSDYKGDIYLGKENLKDIETRIDEINSQSSQEIQILENEFNVNIKRIEDSIKVLEKTVNVCTERIKSIDKSLEEARKKLSDILFIVQNYQTQLTQLQADKEAVEVQIVDLSEKLLELINKDMKTAVFVAISPNEKSKFLIQAKIIEAVILNNIRHNDILINYAPNKYFLIMFVNLYSSRNSDVSRLSVLSFKYNVISVPTVSLLDSSIVYPSTPVDDQIYDSSLSIDLLFTVTLDATINEE